MDDVMARIADCGLPGRDAYDLPTSAVTFPDGTRFRVEIPSVEGPAALRAVIDEAAVRGVRVDRVSQGSGIQLLSDDEIVEMVALGTEHAIEVCLFTGPRAGWDTGSQVLSQSGRVVLGALRGSDQLLYGVVDVDRACRLGIRSVLVGDLGQLWLLDQLKRRGELPADLILKVSISLPVANAATARVMTDLGASTINLPVDLALPSIAAIRQATALPIDLYIEAADDFGGTIRYHEVAELVRVASPVYLKFTVRNAPSTYPSGGHLQGLVLQLSRERVRRAQLGLSFLARGGPEHGVARVAD